jgi:hypothetical protein
MSLPKTASSFMIGLPVYEGIIGNPAFVNIRLIRDNMRSGVVFKLFYGMFQPSTWSRLPYGAPFLRRFSPKSELPFTAVKNIFDTPSNTSL